MDDPWGSSPWVDEVQITSSNVKPETEARPSKTFDSLLPGSEQSTRSPWEDEDDGSFVGVARGRHAGLRISDCGWAGSHLKNYLENGLAVEHLKSEREQPIQSVSSTVRPQSVCIPLADPWMSGTHGHLNDQNQHEVSNDGQSISYADRFRETSSPIRKYEDDPISLPDVDRFGTAFSPDRVVSMSSNMHRLSDSNTGRTLSRPSSSPSDHSHHDNFSPESPRTSFDEDLRRPPIATKTSSKVEQLVQHFDGLAKQRVCQSSDSLRHEDGKRSSVDVMSENVIDDFGDFEEGKSMTEDAVFDISQDKSVSEQLLGESHGIVKFDVDTSSLAKVYPNLPPDTVQESQHIPDTVLHDSFSSIEQRKLWYRVSRYGTMRKHKTSDAENYIRVNWAHSMVRNDTVKIVGRWLEEDRLVGRVVLDGTHLSKTGFEWDDLKTGPISLAQAFSERRSNRRPAELPGRLRGKSTSLVKNLSESSPRVRFEQQEFPTPRRKIPKAPSEEPKSLCKSSPKTRAASISKSRCLPNSMVSLDSDIGPRPATFEWPSSGRIENASINQVTDQKPFTSQNIAVHGTMTDLQPPLSFPSQSEEKNEWHETMSSSMSHRTSAQSMGVAWNQKLQHIDAAHIKSESTWTQLPASELSHNQMESRINFETSIRHQLSPSATAVVSKQRMDSISLAEPVDNQNTINIDRSSDHSDHFDHFDPWTDLSIFEKDGASLSGHAAILKAAVTITSSNKNSTPPKAQDPKSKDEADVNEIVQLVVNSLPDLSYMFRR